MDDSFALAEDPPPKKKNNPWGFSPSPFRGPKNERKHKEVSDHIGLSIGFTERFHSVTVVYQGMKQLGFKLWNPKHPPRLFEAHQFPKSG